MLTGKIIGFSEEELYLSSLGVRTNTMGLYQLMKTHSTHK